MKTLLLFFPIFTMCVLKGAVASTSSLDSNLAKLTKLFQQNYDSIYEPRFCGKNIANFVDLAQQKNIDLTDAQVWKVEGNDFWETSGFYTRSRPNDRVMLGYHHVVLVAFGHVFDFDLYGNQVPPLYQYVRLQFTGPKEPFQIGEGNYYSERFLQSWTVKIYAASTFASAPEQLAKKKLSELIDIPRMMKLPKKSVK